MSLNVGDRLPDASFIEMEPEGPRPVSTEALFGGRCVVLFAVPGAFTPTCDSAHLPSFVRNAVALRARGIDEVVCVAVNDAHVMRRWGQVSGALDVGIRMLSDADGAFTRAIGMAFDAPAVGFHGRSVRYAALVEDRVVRLLHVEESRGVCERTAGETMLRALGAAEQGKMAGP